MNRKSLNQDPEIVAQELLGQVLVRKIKDGKRNKELKARIVETEAYYDETDPASRARQNGDLRKTMEMGAGTILIYGVHNNWLLNFVTENKGKASAVLIRAVEPLNFNEKTNGPGLLTKALLINKDFHKKNIFNNDEFKFKISSRKKGMKVKIIRPEIGKSFRIGVSKDLKKKLRFYIKGNKYVSKK